jgi:predicted nucleotidyltransferase
MSEHIDLKSEHLSIVKNILRLHLPSSSKVWLFGSRSTGNAKKFSDIDLLIDTGFIIPLKKITELNLAFEESNLPYKVDIVDAAAISEPFLINIQSQLIKIDF